MNNTVLFLPAFLFFLLSAFLLSACSGAAGKKAAILNALNSNLETAPLPVEPKNEEERNEAIKEDNEATEEEAEPEPEDPKAFTYFPYDLQLDTLALMTCEVNSPGFSFKAGAYFERSGLRLSEYFLRKKALMTDSELKALIESSTTHRAFASFFYRSKTNFLAAGYTIPFGISLWRHLDELIATGATRLREIEGEGLSARISRGEESLSFAQGLNESWRLGVFYKGNKGVIHKTGGDQGIDFYGRIYKVGVHDRGNNRYHLNSVSENKLPEGPSQKDWVCPESLRFEIRRHPERAWSAQRFYDAQNAEYKKKYPNLERALNAEGTHKIEPDEALCPTSNAKGPALTVARKVLGDSWNINISKKCINLKTNSGSCYISRFHRLASSRESCQNNQQGYAYCPHYLSICVRKN